MKTVNDVKVKEQMRHINVKEKISRRGRNGNQKKLLCTHLVCYIKLRKVLNREEREAESEKERKREGEKEDETRTKKETY